MNPLYEVARVTAGCPPIYWRLVAEEQVLTGGYIEPEYSFRPWAVLASCNVTFHFGRFVRSKLMTGRVAFDDEPSEAEVAGAVDVACREVLGRMAAHGIAVPETHPIINRESAS